MHQNFVCYPHSNAIKKRNYVPWRILEKAADNTYIMCRTVDSRPQYMPLYIHSFRLLAPRKLLEAQLFNMQYRCYEDIAFVPDRLRWCRHSMGYMQSEVAEMLGISRAVYIDLECGVTQHLPDGVAEKLSQLYNLPVTDFLDEFNRFLYDGQAQRIRAYRESLGLGRKPFARYTGIPLSSLRGWEDGKKVISIKCWERYFKGRA